MTDTPPPTNMTGAEFAQALAALDWKQVDFAARAGVAADTVNRWIHDRQPIPAWAAAHVRLLLAADQFHRLHVAPLPRSRRRAGVDQPDGESA
jgi:hypothetical protein